MTDRWPNVLEMVRSTIGERDFNKWVKPTGVQIDGHQIHLVAPNHFICSWLQLHHEAAFKKALHAVYGQADDAGNCYQLLFTVADRPESEAQTTPTLFEPAIAPEAAPPRRPLKQPDAAAKNLTRGNFTFDSYVVGSSNQFAHAACAAAAEAPGEIYSPLFIYGGVGLGKTHLLNAIANQIQARQPSARICYLSSERFINILINSLRLKKMEEFRRRYRNGCDVLLIDDIQFIAGKERSQEEFFHTFNTLYEQKKQIVLSSDKIPKEIPGLEERLRSRFESGLIADIQPPELETRIAILKKKAEWHNMSLPNDVAHFLASSITHNVRELEGSLVRLSAYASLMGRIIDLPFAEEVFKDLVKKADHTISIERIQTTVANAFNIKDSDLRSDRKFRYIALPRQIAMYLSRQLTNSSFPDIGNRFGGRDHSTVVHAVKKISARLKQDNSLRNTVDSIEKTLRNGSYQ